MHSALNIYLDLKLKNFLSHEEELVFEKIIIVESILSQFFIKFQFHVTNLDDQNFMSFLFYIAIGYLGHDPIQYLRLKSSSRSI